MFTQLLTHYCGSGSAPPASHSIFDCVCVSSGSRGHPPALTAACRGGLDRCSAPLRSAPLRSRLSPRGRGTLPLLLLALLRPVLLICISPPPAPHRSPPSHALWAFAVNRRFSLARRAIKASSAGVACVNNKAVSLPPFVVRCRPDSARFLDPSISPAPAESGWVAKPSTDLDGKPPLIIYGTAIRLSVGAVCACDRIQFVTAGS
jgi:hypothetical protein